MTKGEGKEGRINAEEGATMMADFLVPPLCALLSAL